MIDPEGREVFKELLLRGIRAVEAVEKTVPDVTQIMREEIEAFFDVNDLKWQRQRSAILAHGLGEVSIILALATECLVRVKALDFDEVDGPNAEAK